MVSRGYRGLQKVAQVTRGLTIIPVIPVIVT